MSDNLTISHEAIELAKYAKKLCEEGRADEAWGIAETLMERLPHSANPVILASFVAWKMRKMPLAYQLGVRGAQLAPQESTAWLNVGIGAQEIWLHDEAEVAYKTAARLADNDIERGMAKMNLCGLYTDMGDFVLAEVFARESLKLLPDSKKAKANLGFALLGQRKWEGWDWYSHCLGLNARQAMQYRNEGPWDGAKGLTVVCYGEQGLGDELSFASMLPDAIKDCQKVIVDCDPKLQGLFQRSFPTAKVYGTRSTKAEEGVKWDKEDWNIDASIALGELGKYYRTTDESFTGEPYLVADPERRFMWKMMFSQHSKPVIGLAWTGGLYHTGEKFRTLSLEQLYPLMASIDAKWVSLQYKDAGREIAGFKAKHPEIDISQYGFATLTADYDDTAAMVAELDLVICMQTAVAHLAGALGKECWVLLPKFSQFRYGMTGETIPWYKSLRVFRQRKLQDWQGPIAEATGRLTKRYPRAMAA